MKKPKEQKQDEDLIASIEEDSLSKGLYWQIKNALDSEKTLTGGKATHKEFCQAAIKALAICRLYYDELKDDPDEIELDDLITGFEDEVAAGHQTTAETIEAIYAEVL